MLTHDQREHKAAFDEYVRRGESGNLRALETKAMSVGSNPDGGYTGAGRDREDDFRAALRDLADPLDRGRARDLRQRLQEAVHDHGPAVGWVGETDARTQTTSPTLDSLSFPAMELYAMPAATATLLDDAAVEHRRVARRRGRAGVRRAGGRRLRQRRRHQQAEGLPAVHDDRGIAPGPGPRSATSRPAPPARSTSTSRSTR